MAQLTWTVPANTGSPITGYTITRDGTTVATVSASTLSYATTIAGSYTVAAVNADGTWPFSNAVVYGQSLTYSTTPIPASPVLDANSASRSAAVLVGTTNPNQGKISMGGALYVTTASDPLKAVVATSDTNYLIGGTAGLLSTWGPQFRVPVGAAGGYEFSSTAADNDFGDHWMYLRDTTPRSGAPYGVQFDFWRFRYNNTTQFECASLSVWALNSDGSLSFTKLAGSGTGAGLSCQMTLAQADLTVDTPILHAIAFSSPGDKVSTGYVEPATKTDGTVTPTTSTLIEGKRVQLDPSKNLDSVAGLNAGTVTAKFQKRIGTAYQVYGGYLLDRAGAGNPAMYFGVFSQDATDINRSNPTAALPWGHPGDALRAANGSNPAGIFYGIIPYDYFEFPDVPWRTGTVSNVRVLKSWNGT